MKGFGSDNHASVHPQLLGSIQQANFDHAPSYGTDVWTEESDREFKNIFGENSQSFYVFNGTAANVLALKSMIQSFESVLCSDVSHLNVDECGAPEFFTGGKLIPIPSQEGKLQLSDLKQALIRRGDQHFSQVRAISLTQPTEMGTVYSLQELREITAWAHSEKLLVHMDGARICNASQFLGCSLRQMTSDIGIDVISFGGTKNGFLFGEAVIFLNQELARNFKYLRKQGAQLPSKTRFIACQFSTYLKSGLYKEIAAHSCAMAERLYQGLKKIPGIQITTPRQSNAVFVILPKNKIKEIRQKYFFYVWNEKTFECRIMCSWDTLPEEVDNFINFLKEATADE